MFIVIEGVDGSGKSSVVRGVKERLDQMGIRAATTREPGGTPIAEELRKIILTTELDVFAETNLLFAARSDHWHKVIKPLTEDGVTVISDRFATSTWVYQVKLRGLPQDTFINHMGDLYESANIDGLFVQHEFILDVPFEVAQERMAARGEDLNRFDAVSKSVFELKRQSYMRATDVNEWSENVHVLDATKSLEFTISEILRTILNVNHVLPC